MGVSRAHRVCQTGYRATLGKPLPFAPGSAICEKNYMSESAVCICGRIGAFEVVCQAKWKKSGKKLDM